MDNNKEATDKELRESLMDDLTFLNGMFASLCSSKEIRQLFFYGTSKIRLYLEGGLTAEDLDEDLTDSAEGIETPHEVLRGYQ